MAVDTPPEIIIHMTQSQTCIERRSVEWKPVPVEQTEGKNLGDYVEYRNTVNGRIDGQRLMVFDGRKWWDITAVPDCVPTLAAPTKPAKRKP